MSDDAIDHGTVVIEHVVNVPVARTYAAFADAQERTKWAAPSDTAVYVYEEADFRVGGRDVARCGPRDDPRFRVESRYIDIVPHRRVVTVETIHDLGTLLATNINSIEFFPEGNGTRLKVTVQVASFIGPGMIANTRAGHIGSLANIAAYLEKSNA